MAVASSSSSSLTFRWEKYDVYLSFRGKDVRNTFVRHLFNGLIRKNINTYADFELERGVKISTALFEAIQGSRISVVILSQNYASSSWCLRELAYILKCWEERGQIVIPVYYKIDPSDLRRQKGGYGAAFAKHEGRFKDRMDEVSEWRYALTEIANISGFVVDTYSGNEAKSIEEIVEYILKKLEDPALDIFSCPIPTISKGDELPMTDQLFHNYNAQFIPLTALKTILKKILKRQDLASRGMYKDDDVDSGHLSGLVFVSERHNLKTLYIALRFDHNTSAVEEPKVRVFSLADVFGTTVFNGVCMEDRCCFVNDYIIYVTDRDHAPDGRQPWTAVYKTNLETKETERLTPPEQADLNPSTSPSGKMIAVASFEERKGEIKDLRTDIFVMNVEKPFDRKLVVKNGRWPTWGSENIIFFHRKVGMYWGVFRANIRKGFTPETPRVTPDGIDAMTPAAINSTTVAVATIRQISQFGDVRVATKYHHIEIFHSSGLNPSIRITQKIRPHADHFNPFVIDGKDGKRIGYHR